MHFPISPHHNLKKGRSKQQGVSSLSMTWRILSRQQSRKSHCSLQSAVSIAYFAPLLTQAGEWKGEQKCIRTGVTLFFPPFASPEWVWSKVWPAGAAFHPSTFSYRPEQEHAHDGDFQSLTRTQLTPYSVKGHYQDPLTVNEVGIQHHCIFLDSLSTKFDHNGSCRQHGCISLYRWKTGE